MHIQLILKKRKNKHSYFLKYLVVLTYIIGPSFPSIGQLSVPEIIRLPCDSIKSKLIQLSPSKREKIVLNLEQRFRSSEKWECLYKLNYFDLITKLSKYSYAKAQDYLQNHIDPIFDKVYHQIDSVDQLEFEIDHLLLQASVLDLSEEHTANLESSLLHIISKLDSTHNLSENLLIQYAMVYNGICFLYEEQGRYHEGLQAAQYIIHVLVKKYGIEGQVRKYGNMNTLAGAFAMYTGELDIAEDNIQKAITFFLKLHKEASKKGQPDRHNPSLRNLYLELAQVKLRQRKDEDFLNLMIEAEKYKTTNPSFEVEPILLRGKYLQDNKEYVKAIEEFEKTFQYIPASDTTHHLILANVYNSLGECAWHQHKTSKAIELFNMALYHAIKIRQKNTDKSNTTIEAIRSCRNLAKLHLNQSNLDTAYTYGQNLVNELQLIRSDQYFLLDKIRLLEKTYDDYGILLNILFEQGDTQEAYQVMQLGKAQLIKEAKIKSLYQQQSGQEADTRIEDIQSQLLSDSISQKAIDSLTNKLYKLNEQLKYKQSKHIKESVLKATRTHLTSLSDFKNKLHDDELFLEYYLGNEYAFCLEVSQTSTKLHRLTHPDSIQQLAINFSGALINKTNLERVAARLSKLLLPSTIDTAYHRFIIIPDGILHYIPFEFLNFKENKLINHGSVCYLLYNDMHQSSSPIPIGSNDILLFAPSFTTDEFQNLKHSSIEVMEINQITQGKIHLGSAATKSQFVKESPSYKILHLSTHAIMDETNAEQSYIVFHNANSNYKLFLHQIEQLPLETEMVVLSACETGVGKLLNGEGMFSMKKAFFQAGSKSVISSLWRSNDQTTAEIMSYFYSNLKEGKTKDEALRLAKLKYISLADPGYDHPYYWAGFIAVGDMSPLSFSDFDIMKYLLPVGLFTLFLLFVWLLKPRRLI